MAKKVSIELTENEFNAIWAILGCGWDEGEFATWGLDPIATQNRALKKFNQAFTTLKGGRPAYPFKPIPPRSQWTED